MMCLMVGLTCLYMHFIKAIPQLDGEASHSSVRCFSWIGSIRGIDGRRMPNIGLPWQLLNG